MSSPAMPVWHLARMGVHPPGLRRVDLPPARRHAAGHRRPVCPARRPPQPILPAMDSMAAHKDRCSPRCSSTMRDNRLICRIVAGALLIASLLTAGLDLEWRGQIREAQAADAWPSVTGNRTPIGSRAELRQGEQVEVLSRYPLRLPGEQSDLSRRAICPRSA